MASHDAAYPPLTKSQREADDRYHAETGKRIVNLPPINSMPMNKKFFRVDPAHPYAECEFRLGFRLLMIDDKGKSYVYPEEECGGPATDKETAYERTRAQWEYYHYMVRINNKLRRAQMREWLSKRLSLTKGSPLDLSTLAKQAAKEVYEAADGSVSDEQLKASVLLAFQKKKAQALVTLLESAVRDLPEEYLEHPSELVIVRARVMQRYFSKMAATLKSERSDPKMLSKLVTALRIANDPEIGVGPYTDDEVALVAARELLKKAETVAKINALNPGADGRALRIAECAAPDKKGVAKGAIIGEGAGALCVPDFVKRAVDESAEAGDASAVADFWRNFSHYIQERENQQRNKAMSYVSPSSKRGTVEAELRSAAKASPGGRSRARSRQA
jgi:hypothetical protein